MLRRWLLAVLSGLVSCKAGDAPTETWWVNSFKVACTGVAPMQCLQVHDGEAPVGEWRNLHQEIAGFDYAPGSLYRVTVRMIERPAAQVPADTSSRYYELVEIVERVPDPRAALHDIFVLEAVGNRSVDGGGTGVAQATIEFNIVEERYSGYDGCIDFEGPITAVDGERLQLGYASSSEDDCPITAAATDLLAALPRITAWRRDGLLLELLDEDGKRRLLFRKVD